MICDQHSSLSTPLSPSSIIITLSYLLSSGTSVPAVRPSFRATSLHLKCEDRNFTPALTFDHLRPSCERATPGHQKFACHHPTRTISAEGCAGQLKSQLIFCSPSAFISAQPPKNRVLPHVRASDTHDLRRGLRPTNRIRITRLCVRHARSPQRVTFRWTRPGCPCRLKRGLRRTLEDLRSSCS
jgi:hypothetical protein